MGVKEIRHLGGMERCQKPLVYLPCYATAPRVLLSSRSKARHRAWEPIHALRGLLAAAPSAGCSQLPLASV